MLRLWFREFVHPFNINCSLDFFLGIEAATEFDLCVSTTSSFTCFWLETGLALQIILPPFSSNSVFLRADIVFMPFLTGIFEFYKACC